MSYGPIPASGTATGLATTGAPVGVSGAAPPTVGQVLTATGPTTADWANAGAAGTMECLAALTTNTSIVSSSGEHDVWAANTVGPKKVTGGTSQAGDQITIRLAGNVTAPGGTGFNFQAAAGLGASNFSAALIAVPAGFTGTFETVIQITLQDTGHVQAYTRSNILSTDGLTSVRSNLTMTAAIDFSTDKALQTEIYLSLNDPAAAVTVYTATADRQRFS